MSSVQVHCTLYNVSNTFGVPKLYIIKVSHYLYLFKGAMYLNCTMFIVHCILCTIYITRLLRIHSQNDNN